LDLLKYREKAGFFRFYLVLTLSIALVFYLGYKLADEQLQSLQKENDVLSNSVDNLRQVNEKLQSNINMLQVELDIIKLANQKSLQANKEILTREQDLKEQVSFYQRVMAPEMAQDGFLVERMEVSPTASQNNYAVKMILLQHEDIKSVIKGDLAINVHGSAEGEPKTYLFSRLQDEPKTPLKFAFKYFQVLETTITLPDGFTPERFELKTDVYKYRKKRGSYSTTIQWDEALSE